MSDTKKIFQILIKRYSLWIVMLLAIFIILEGSSTSYQASVRLTNEIYYSTSELDYLYNNIEAFNIEEIEDNIENFREISQYGLADDYIDKYVRMFDEIIKEKNIDRDKLTRGDYLDGSKSISSSDQDSDIYYILYKFNNLLENNKIVKDPSDGLYKINISNHVIMPNLLIYGIIFLLGVLMFSGEHLTRYYEFTRMFPWSKNKTYLAKILFGLSVIIGAWLIATGLKLLIFNNSNYSNISCIYKLSENLIKHGVSIVSFYLIVMGVGSLAGNFIGHIGMVIMAMFGIRLYQYNAWALVSIFNGDGDLYLLNVLEDKISSSHPIIKTVISPLDGFIFNEFTIELSLGLLLLAVIFFLLGMFWTKSSQSERSQMPILRSRESNFVKFMAILTSSNIIQLISNSFGINGIATFIVFIFSIFITYKFYSILFSSRIGFQS